MYGVSCLPVVRSCKHFRDLAKLSGSCERLLILSLCTQTPPNIPFRQYETIKMANFSSSTMIKVSIVAALVVAAALIAAGFNSNNGEVRRIVS